MILPYPMTLLLIGVSSLGGVALMYVVDVGLGLATRGDRQGELAGRVPRHRALVLEHLGQVTEDRHALEGVVGPERIVPGVVAHRCIVGG